MSIIISSFFTNAGVPATGLSPTIRIWEVAGGSQNLIIGAPNGSFQNTDAPMVEVTDGVSDGFYKFLFTDAMGYDKNKTFVARAFGGNALPIGERYQVVGLNPSEAIDTQLIADSVWNEPTGTHNVGGSFGERINIINSTTQAIALSVIDCQNLLDILIKYEVNRTKIDPIAKTLTVYDDDCTTALRVFQLLDSTGTPSVDSVCERKPISATDGQGAICP
jgi:hypothetical protein